MLSVGELPTVMRVLKDWRKVHYKDDPMKEQLYREEFMKNKNDLVHPNMFDYLRDERAWRNDDAEHQKHIKRGPSSSSSSSTSSSAAAANNNLNRPTNNIVTSKNDGVYSVVGEVMVAESPDFVGQDTGAPGDKAAPVGDKRQPPGQSGLRLGAGGGGAGDEGRGHAPAAAQKKEGLQFAKEEVVMAAGRPSPSPSPSPSLTPSPPAAGASGQLPKSAGPQPSAAAAGKSFLSAAISQWETALAVGIYVCCTTTTGAKVPPLRVRVPEGATVERVLKEVRRKASEVGMPFNMDPQAYSLRIAEDDGTPDYDTPQLNADVEVKRFPQLRFCMVDSPLFVKSVASTSTSAVTSISSPRLLRVAMGADQFQTFEKGKDLKLKDILWRVCTKSSMDYTQHALHLINSDEPLPLDMPAADVPGDMLTLVKKERASKYRGSRSSSSLVRSSAKARPGPLSSGKKIPTLFRSQVNMLDSKEPSDDDEEEDESRDTPFGKPSFTFWNKEKAFRLKRYEVTKMTKFNIKQERVLGIDRDRITNASKRKSGEPSGSQPTWKLIKNVVEAKVSETKSSQFTLTFEEEGKENVTHTFEALNPQEACEIVEKIKCCKNSM
ncbi:uncharacterized protein ACA1_285480 [Acanthamoeba castellanii str. Neff]|uniref:SIN1-type PH domain-containing protein n=1 Tax=Acanthamoeba castellanii (strain ATCC 30010 / Neff) TaxID=1257118 RepID=L8H6Q5_ACACF|nr:uncharacterized protein ACA1_285480 [Acanthamoeba castellanii str. Neff]ELR21189.1 hypothetical protein ACA1_285480 [Acanthamoeba castellanii str. Neff]